MIRDKRQNPAWAWQKTAQLRQLALALQRAKDTAERRRRLADFEGYRHSLRGERLSDHLPTTAAILAGFQACWAGADYAGITEMASRLPSSWLQPPSLIGAYVAAARTALGDILLNG